MRRRAVVFLGLAVLSLYALPAVAETESARFSSAGYFRVMARPDLQGGDNRLGHWNLYGRLLNEGPWAALELKLDLQPKQAGEPTQSWTSVHAKIEGGSIPNTDPLVGALQSFRLTQLYVQSGNVGLRNVTWQLGTLDSYFGDLALYDMKPTEIFWETVGMSARYRGKHLEVLLGAGDSGYALHGLDYNTVLTTGGSVRLRLGNHVEAGAGGTYLYEPAVPGNRHAPFMTPGIRYEDLLRGEVVQRFLEAHPGQEDQFTRPVPVDATSYKVVGYVGFGKAGPVRWNNLYVNYLRKHPEQSVTETYDGRDYTIYVAHLTDQRYQVNIGNEMYITLVPGRLDAVWGVLAGQSWDDDNELAPSDSEMTVASTLLRLQYYMSLSIHLLAEGSVARETSHQGNLFRQHADSVFENSAGVPDTRGLEFGDSNERNTIQGKAGIVFNPLGPGILSRPSLRFLYGVQYSDENNAFGNSFVEDVDQYNYFGNQEEHWHHVFAVEAEAWF